MPKKTTIPPALPGTQSQLRDAKGVNAKAVLEEFRAEIKKVSAEKR